MAEKHQGRHRAGHLAWLNTTSQMGTPEGRNMLSWRARSAPGRGPESRPAYEARVQKRRQNVHYMGEGMG